MAFCNKCGNKLDDEDLFCSKCGAKVKLVEENSSEEPVKAPEEPEKKVQEVENLSKDELLKILERYRKNVVTQKQLREKKTEAASRADSRERPLLSESAPLIKFYWPFIVAGLVLLMLTYVITIFAAMSGRGALIVLAVGILATLAAFIGGIVVAKRNQAAALYQIKEHNGRIKRRQHFAEEHKKISNELARIDKLVQQDSEYVPAKYKSADKVSKLVVVFKNPDVKTIEEAIDILEKKKRL